jgi:hypothetical protein
MKAGGKVLIDYGRDPNGQWWWRSGSIGPRGPFATEAEAHRDSEVTMLGPQCKVRYGGRWDPACDKAQ